MSNQNQIQTVRGLLQKDSIKDRVNEIMGKRGPQFSAALVQLVKQNYMLQNCKPESVIGSALTAAALDLPLDPNIGQAYVVPYGKEAQFQIGYKGFIQLAQRSGQMKRMSDNIIPKGALISWDPLNEDLVVDWESPDIDWDAKPDGYSFFFRTASGFEKTVFWSYDRVLAHAKRFSKSFNKATSPWQTDFDAMALKTVIKFALGRYGPLSVEVQTNVAKDQGVIDIDGNTEYVDNDHSGNGRSNLKRAEVEDMTGDDVTEAQEIPEEKAEEKESNSAADEKEKKHNIEVIENAILDVGFDFKKFFQFIKDKKLCAASATDFKDIPAPKIKIIFNKIDDLVNEFGAL